MARKTNDTKFRKRFTEIGTRLKAIGVPCEIDPKAPLQETINQLNEVITAEEKRRGIK